MTGQDRGTAWFLAQLKPNSHGIAERNLARQGLPSFLPRLDETRRARGRFVTALRPLFPGYIFVALDIAAGRWRAVNSTHGISRLVRFGAAPAPVPPGLIAGLMARCDAVGRLGPAAGLAPGDRVRVTGGPFAGFLASIEAIAPDRRVWLLLESMGQQARVAVAGDQVRRS